MKIISICLCYLSDGFSSSGQAALTVARCVFLVKLEVFLSLSLLALTSPFFFLHFSLHVLLRLSPSFSIPLSASYLAFFFLNYALHVFLAFFLLISSLYVFLRLSSSSIPLSTSYLASPSSIPLSTSSFDFLLPQFLFLHLTSLLPPLLLLRSI